MTTSNRTLATLRGSIANAAFGPSAGYPTWLTRTWATACPAGTGVAGGAGVADCPAGGVWLVHASGSRLAATAIAATLGAYFVLYPGSRVLKWIFPVFLVRIPAWIFLGLWFLYQLIEANFGLFSASANGGGVAFFAHVGGFIFGLLAARLLARARQAVPRERWRSTA